jgi:hypothetical protein
VTTYKLKILHNVEEILSLFERVSSLVNSFLDDKILGNFCPAVPRPALRDLTSSTEVEIDVDVDIFANAAWSRRRRFRTT